jgi:hypothetical protein
MGDTSLDKCTKGDTQQNQRQLGSLTTQESGQPEQISGLSIACIMHSCGSSDTPEIGTYDQPTNFGK